MNTLIKTTSDGRKVEVIGMSVCLDGKKETDYLVTVAEHPNRAKILEAVPDATHMAGRIPLTAEEAIAAKEAMDAAKAAYDNSPLGIAERIRATQRNSIASRD